jgi:hypothetical protein
MHHSETVVTTQRNAAALGTYLIFRVSIWGISPRRASRFFLFPASRSEGGPRPAIARNPVAGKGFAHEHDRVSGRSHHRAGMVEIGVDMLLDHRASRAGLGS